MRIASRSTDITVTAAQRRPPAYLSSASIPCQVGITIITAQMSAPRNGCRIQSEAAIRTPRNSTARTMRVRSRSGCGATRDLCDGEGARDIGPWSHCWGRRDLLQCKDAMRIVIGNLPDDVSEEGIREALKGFAPVEKVKLVKESGTPSALIEMEMTRASAEALARRISGRVYQGRPLRAWVPVMDW